MSGHQALRKFAEQDRREAEGWQRWWDAQPGTERARLTAEDPRNAEPWGQPYEFFLDGGPKPEPELEDPVRTDPRPGRLESIVFETKARQRKRSSNQSEGRRHRYLARRVAEGRYPDIATAERMTLRRKPR